MGSKIRMSSRLKKVCDLLRLERINSLVLVKNNESNRKLISIIKDFVAYGFISYNMLLNLLVKRGRGRVFDRHHNALNVDLIERGVKGEISLRLITSATAKRLW